MSQQLCYFQIPEKANGGRCLASDEQASREVVTQGLSNTSWKMKDSVTHTGEQPSLKVKGKMLCILLEWQVQLLPRKAILLNQIFLYHPLCYRGEIMSIKQKELRENIFNQEAPSEACN